MTVAFAALTEQKYLQVLVQCCFVKHWVYNNSNTTERNRRLKKETKVYVWVGRSQTFSNAESMINFHKSQSNE